MQDILKQVILKLQKTVSPLPDNNYSMGEMAQKKLANIGLAIQNSGMAKTLDKGLDFVRSSQPYQVVPTFNVAKRDNVQGNIANVLANLPGQVVNSSVGGILNTASDIGRTIGSVATGQGAPQYNTLKSPFSRLGQNFAGINQKETAGNVAGVGLDLLNAYTPKALTNVGSNLADKGALQAVMQGAKQGALMGGGGGVLQGISENRASDPRTQGYEALKGGLLGAGTGALVGGALSGAGQVTTKAMNMLRDSIQSTNPNLTPQQVNEAAKKYIRDEVGRFATGKDVAKVKVGAFYDDPYLNQEQVLQLRSKLGLPENYNKGEIDLGATIGGKADDGMEAIKKQLKADVKAGKITIGEYQQKMQGMSNPDLPAYENAMNAGDMKTVKALASKHAEDARFQVHNNVVDPLVEEARKYKSAEEFVNAQGIPLYHGGSNVSNYQKELKILSPEEKLKYPSRGGGYEGFSTTLNKKIAEGYSQSVGKNDVAEFRINPRAKELTVDTKGAGLDEMFTAQQMADLRKKGYDLIRDTSKGQEDEIRLLTNEAVFTPFQLTDIWNKANKPNSKESLTKALQQLKKK